MLTSRHKKAPESFDSEALNHDYYIWVKNGNLRKLKIGIYHKKIIMQDEFALKEVGPPEATEQNQAPF